MSSFLSTSLLITLGMEGGPLTVEELCRRVGYSTTCDTPVERFLVHVLRRPPAVERALRHSLARGEGLIDVLDDGRWIATAAGGVAADKIVANAYARLEDW